MLQNLVDENLVEDQCTVFDGEKARSLFGIPEGWEPAAMMAIGYLGDPQTLPESLREQELAPRIRKPLTEFIFTGNWNQTSDLVTN